MKPTAPAVSHLSADCQHSLASLAAARELCATLVHLLDALAEISDGDSFWLRPLARASGDLEFSLGRGPNLNPQTLGGVCRDLLELLAAEPQAKGFAARYARARQALPRLRALHERAQLGCRDVVMAEAPSAAF